jgi:hypothetical protein
MSVAHVQQLVSSGRVTPAEGALLLELRYEIAWRRKPWWHRLIIVLFR